MGVTGWRICVNVHLCASYTSTQVMSENIDQSIDKAWINDVSCRWRLLRTLCVLQSVITGQ